MWEGLLQDGFLQRQMAQGVEEVPSLRRTGGARDGLLLLTAYYKPKLKMANILGNICPL